MNTTLPSYLDFITETVYQAGRISLGYFQTGIQAEYKPDDTPVTVADRLVEDFIRNRIETRFPTHAIIGEEYGLKEFAGASHRWFIDPIDGTKSFMRGVPLYAVLVGLEIDGNVEVGAAYFPALDEMLTAATSMGCWWNGRRAHVSTISNLSKGVVSCTDLTNFARVDRQAAWERLQKTAYYRTGWGDAYGYLLVATGRIELMLDPIINVWDCAPFPPIFREAGGYFGNWEGKPTIYDSEGIATSQILLPEVLRLIAGN